MHDDYNWRPVVGFPLYEVSRQGQVRNINTGRMLRIQKNNQGHLYVPLRYQGATKNVLVHTLVAEAFEVRKPRYMDTVAHLDGDKENCSVDNLMYTNRRYTVKKTYERRRTLPLDHRKVIASETGHVFENCLAAAEWAGILEEDVLDSCRYGVGYRIGRHDWQFYYGEREPGPDPEYDPGAEY